MVELTQWHFFLKRGWPNPSVIPYSTIMALNKSYKSQQILKFCTMLWSVFQMKNGGKVYDIMLHSMVYMYQSILYGTIT